MAKAGLDSKDSKSTAAVAASAVELSDVTPVLFPEADTMAVPIASASSSASAVAPVTVDTAASLPLTITVSSDGAVQGRPMILDYSYTSAAECQQWVRKVHESVSKIRGSPSGDWIVDLHTVQDWLGIDFAPGLLGEVHYDTAEAASFFLPSEGVYVGSTDWVYCIAAAFNLKWPERIDQYIGRGKRAREMISWFLSLKL